MIDWVKLILIATDVPVVIAAVLGVLSLRTKDKLTNIFGVFLLYSGIIQILALLLWLLKINNMPLLHLYVPSGFILISMFYGVVFKTLINPIILKVLAIGFVVYSLLNTIFIEDLFSFNSYALSVESILLIILSIFTYLVFLGRKKDADNVQEKTGIIWINSGIFLYYTANLLFFYFGSYIMSRLSVSASSYTWAFHSFYSIVMNCLFIVGLWKRRRIFI